MEMCAKTDLRFSCLLCGAAVLCVMNEPCAGCRLSVQYRLHMHTFSRFNNTPARTPVKSPPRCWDTAQGHIVKSYATPPARLMHTHKSTQTDVMQMPPVSSAVFGGNSREKRKTTRRESKVCDVYVLGDMNNIYDSANTAHRAFAEGQI